MTENFSELLARAQSGSTESMEALIAENSGLIWSVVKRFTNHGTEAEDLFQLGSIGFIKAVQGFDPQYGTQFSTYAVPKIAGEIRRFLRDNGAVKVSRTLKERSASIKAARSRFISEQGREPSVGELSEVMELTPEEIAGAELSTAPLASLQEECGENGITHEAVLSDGYTEERVLDHVCLRDAITRLPEREQKVIRLRYYHDLTQEKAARLLGVSQVQISRLERRAIELLRDEFFVSV